MSYSQSKYAGSYTGTTIGTTNGTWSNINPSNCLGSPDGSMADQNLSNTPQVGDPLLLTSYGFSIPSSATIIGVSVTPTWQWQIASCNEYAVQLIKGGTAQGNNNANTSTALPTTLTPTVFGGSSDLWGLSLTYSDVNASNFGVSITAQNVNTYAGGTEPTPSVDAVQITVYYTLPAGFGGGAILLGM